MDVVQVIAAISTVIKTLVDLGPTVIKAEQDAQPFAAAIVGMFKGTNISPEDLAALENKIDDLVAQLMVPLPPDDGTTTT